MWENILDRLLNKETLYALIIGGATLGLYVISPETVEILTATLVGIWTLFKLWQKKE